MGTESEAMNGLITSGKGRYICACPDHLIFHVTLDYSGYYLLVYEEDVLFRIALLLFGA